MNSDDRIVRIFKTLDQGALIELAVIIVAAGLLIHLLQRLLPGSPAACTAENGCTCSPRCPLSGCSSSSPRWP